MAKKNKEEKIFLAAMAEEKSEVIDLADLEDSLLHCRFSEGKNLREKKTELKALKRVKLAENISGSRRTIGRNRNHAELTHLETERCYSLPIYGEERKVRHEAKKVITEGIAQYFEEVDAQKEQSEILEVMRTLKEAFPLVIVQREMRWQDDQLEDWLYFHHESMYYKEYYMDLEGAALRLYNTCIKLGIDPEEFGLNPNDLVEELNF